MGSCYVALASLELNPLASASQVLELKVCTTAPSLGEEDFNWEVNALGG